MLLFHGTSENNLSAILACGVNAESYWGTFEQASSFANSFDNGIILQADLDEADLKASILMAESLYDAGDLDKMPDENDIDFSIENLGGCVCLVTVYDFSVVVRE